MTVHPEMSAGERRAGWSITGLALLWILALALCTGCTGPAPDEVQTLATGQVERWRQVRRDGKAWTAAEWDGRLRDYAAAERLVTEWVQTGAIAEGATGRALEAERGAP